MDDLAAQFQAFENAMYAVGSFLHNWGRLETQISHSIFCIDPSASGPHVDPNSAPRMLEALVKRWFTVYCTRTAAQKKQAIELRDGILAAAKHRNTICHGFQRHPSYAAVLRNPMLGNVSQAPHDGTNPASGSFHE